ncbi:hypothetical protein CALCODRAFT_505478 [Calocera cornea HHB12733]|uniref:Uncharacterized protein n=1 Tax=Calocera cornea HHB12733 TaxID=1353952 RepID=A0A165K5Z7_9BASI|nr:hypothetical protein CALCODRAFT_505478 [Calocera cornea HHB12733]
MVKMQSNDQPLLSPSLNPAGRLWSEGLSDVSHVSETILGDPVQMPPYPASKVLLHSSHGSSDELQIPDTSLLGRSFPPACPSVSHYPRGCSAESDVPSLPASHPTTAETTEHQPSPESYNHHDPTQLCSNRVLSFYPQLDLQPISTVHKQLLRRYAVSWGVLNALAFNPFAGSTARVEHSMDVAEAMRETKGYGAHPLSSADASVLEKRLDHSVQHLMEQGKQTAIHLLQTARTTLELEHPRVDDPTARLIVDLFEVYNILYHPLSLEHYVHALNSLRDRTTPSPAFGADVDQLRYEGFYAHLERLGDERPTCHPSPMAHLGQLCLYGRRSDPGFYLLTELPSVN